MVTSRISRVLVATLVAAGTFAASPLLAQAPQGGGMRGMGGMGMMPMDRAGVEQRLALDAEGLNLTAAQKSQIDKIVDDYIVEQGKLREKYPMTPGTPPGQEAMTAMRSSRENLNTAVGKVMNDGQRKTWEAAMAARRPAGPMGPMGPMGPGGPGGPPPGTP
jgi:Spy/CpxP family protein refolding chaperone